MPAPVRVDITHVFTSDPQTVFDALGEHERLGDVFGASVSRVRDGDESRNGVGSVRRLKIGPLPSFEETVTEAEPGRLICYRITKGSPLTGHWGEQRLQPTADGGTRLEYRIGFDARLPGVARIVATALGRRLPQGLSRLVP
ncbi:SRPBCC family protein [Aeromicrobium sp. CTD01-1L150]|uniref:SRPBCC family protein n=1 Tax=Aeromicrobium sp. CTD01-1L150 TaxID=3341830 RepID=UPI0035BED3D0